MIYNFKKTIISNRIKIKALSLMMLCSFPIAEIYADNNNTSAIEVNQKNSKAATHLVTGTVLDETGTPIPGASIIVVGSPRGVMTDLDGTFEIQVSNKDQLTISFLGMGNQTIKAGDQKNIVVKMEPKKAELDEVTVVAFGKQRKVSVIGAINTLSTDQLKMPVAKLSSGLAGQLAGIVVMQRTGEPGAGADFFIRGINTFGANAKPLVLVDGIEREMDLVDPEDIATFSILKDATATALYGVRGANGIVLITTKRGSESAPKVSAKVEYGFSNPVRISKLASAEQWIDYYNDVTLEATGRPAFQPEEKQRYLSGIDPDLYPNVDWMKTIFKDYTNNTRVNVNITGGNSKVRYYVGGSFFTEGSVFNTAKNERYNPSMKYNKFNFRSNVDINITSSTELNISLSTQYETKNRPGSTMSELYSRAIITPAISIPIKYSDGTMSRPAVGANPYNQLNECGYSEDFFNNAQSLIGITQDFSKFVTPGLKANVKFSWDAFNRTTLDRTIQAATYHATGRDEEGKLLFVQNNDGKDYMSLLKSNGGTRVINFEASVNYDRIFGRRHHVGAMMLFNMRERTNSVPTGYIDAFPFRNIGMAGRGTYSFDDKYFAEFNFGYNGSENFSPGRQFGFFPSGAIGYLISNESFWDPIRPIVHLLKIKGSYGEIGNDQIGGNRRFAFNSEMTQSGLPDYYFGDAGTPFYGIATGVPGNQYVSWETARKGNVGIEIGFIEKLKIQLDYFHEKRSGIYIQQESVPSVVGLNVTQYVNLGEMKNQGFDASMEYEQRFNDWYVSARANFTFNRNKKLYDDKPTPIYPYQSEAGFANRQQRGLVALGLFESEQDIASSPLQDFGKVRPGDIKYKDINGDNIINAYDKVAIGYSDTPEINYGFGVSVGWKGFDVSLFFQGVDNITQIISGSALYGASDNALNTGQIYSEVADMRWTEKNPNPNARYPRLAVSKVENNMQPSTFWQRDMSFIRLKNAEIGYTIPKNITKKIGMSTLRFYMQGVNLLTFSDFKLWDPELSSAYGNVYPQMRTVTAGLNINF
ncbi:MAG: TonB-dependent receptor [Muribaculaceae bacterium]